MEKIRQLAASDGSSLVVFGANERRVAVFDCDKLCMLASFDTVLDFGGRRLLIGEDGQTIICGAWERQVLAAYNSLSGTLLWQRKDLKKLQQLTSLPRSRSRCFAHFEYNASRILDINSGEDIELLKGVRNMQESPYLPIDTLEMTDRLEIRDSRLDKLKFKLPTGNMFLLATAFARDVMVVSFAGGPISCYDISNGTLNWSIPENTDGHFIALAYNADGDFFVGVTYDYEVKGSKKLKHINKHTGAIEREYALGRPAAVGFAQQGKYFISSDCEVMLINTGERWRFSPSWLSGPPQFK